MAEFCSLGKTKTRKLLCACCLTVIVIRYTIAKKLAKLTSNSAKSSCWIFCATIFAFNHLIFQNELISGSRFLGSSFYWEHPSNKFGCYKTYIAYKHSSTFGEKKNVAEAVQSLLEIWRKTSIPIVALTTVKRRVLNLLDIRADHVKNRPVGTDGLNIRREYWDSLFDICDHSQDHLLSNKDKCFIASQQTNCSRSRTMSLEEYSRMDIHIQDQVILVPDSFFFKFKTQNVYTRDNCYLIF